MDIINLKCDVQNDTLTYNAFSAYSYEKAVACDWVAADLLKQSAIGTVAGTGAVYTVYDRGEEFEIPEEGRVLKRSLLGNTSTCKTVKKTSTCRSIDNECKRGHALVEQLIASLGSANFPLKELVDGESKLTSFVNSTLQQNLQTLLSGLEGPKNAVEQWASENMPVLYGFFAGLHRYVQKNDLKMDEGSDFYKRVVSSCSFYNEGVTDSELKCDISSILNGKCDENCNNPYCLYDGGSCLDGSAIFTYGSNSFFDAVSGEEKFVGFSPLQQGDELFVNQDYNTSTYSDELRTSLKAYTNSENDLVFDTDKNGTVTDDELDVQLGDLFDSSSKSNVDTLPIWQSPANLFVGVDPEGTCGNPDTWYKSTEMDRPQSWLDGLYKAYDSFYDSVKDILIPALGGGNITAPNGYVPVQNTDVFSCDALSKQQNIPGVQGVNSSEIKAWIDYTNSIFAWFKEKCGADANGEWKTDCQKVVIESAYGDRYNATIPLYYLQLNSDANVVDKLAYLEYAYLGSTARENSGSVRQLLLDAGIKRDSKGYNIVPQVNFESYYKASEVSQCAYSKKIGASPATVITVILGLIGGVTTTASVFALVIYNFFKMRIFKKQKMMEKSNTVPTQGEV